MRDAYRFSATEEFTSEEFEGSRYVPGLRYTVRPDNDKLHAAVERWLAEGKVQIIQPTAGTSEASAAGIGSVN